MDSAVHKLSGSYPLLILCSILGTLRRYRQPVADTLWNRVKRRHAQTSRVAGVTSFKLRPMFSPRRRLPVTEGILLRWYPLIDEDRKTGHSFSQPDLLIAATGAHHGRTVVTREISQFLFFQLRLHKKAKHGPILHPLLR
jgi:predicted nucleic acid-binding protein